VTILIAAFLAVQTVAAPPSTFCVQQRCEPVNEIPGTVAPSDTVRDFVWISSDLKQIATGTIQAGANVLTLPAASQHHKLAPRLSDGSTRATLDFELRCQDLTWKWTVTRVPVPGVDLRHPGSGCTLLLKSNGYRSVERQLRDVEVGNVFLQKIPILSGTVIDAKTATPLPDARVYLPNGDSLAVTDRKGSFRAPVADLWPQFVRVAMAGYARRTVLLPKAVADTELSVRLSKGGSLTISLAPPLGQEEVVWEVRRLLPGPPGDELAHSGRLPAGQKEAFVDALEPGKYRVIVAGADPLQRIGKLVTLTEGGEAEAVMQISSSVLDVTVRYDDKPLAGATVRIQPEDRSWTSSVTTDGEGSVTEEVWQQGTYVAIVTQLPLIPFWRETEHIDGDKNRWSISVPNRRLLGRVMDDPSGQPIRDARIEVTTKNGDHGTNVTLRSGEDGRFELGAFPAGSYMLAVSKSGYQSSQTPWIAVDETATDQTPQVRLKAGNRPVVVTNAFGAPVSAAVYVSTPNGTHLVGATDEDGRILLPVSPEDYGMVFVVPRSGSIGVAPFESLAKGADDILVRVPEGNASLEIDCETISGAALTGVAVLIRINGVLLPIPVWEGMVNYQGLPMFSDDHGRLLLTHLPAGRYELWPLDRQELMAVTSGSPPPARATIAVTAGYQSAKMVFAAAKP
jgi:Carboxypeptidase regulatory-like domain